MNKIHIVAAVSVACASLCAAPAPLVLDVPTPRTAAFEEDGYYVWGGSIVKDDAGTYHMFYSRWKKSYGFGGWKTHSEIARATSRDLFGKFTPQGVVLRERGARFWDGHCTHNPTIHKFGLKYYLYYMGNVYNDGTEGCIAQAPGRNQTQKDNNQRVGVAVADSPEGPWTRIDSPLVDVSDEIDAPDSLITTNPSVTQCPDGSYLMVYKAASRKKGCPVVCLSATSKSPAGPFRKMERPFFTSGESRFPAEDPYVWFADGKYLALVKDMGGHFIKGKGRTVVLFESETGHDWKLADNPLVTDTTVRWDDGTTEKFTHLERPQLYFEDGRPAALVVAVKKSNAHSFNIRIPLGRENAAAAEPGAEETERLKFLTFNIWVDCFNNPVAEREAGVESSIVKAAPDVVALQEVSPNWYDSVMFSNLAMRGYVLVRGDEEAALRRAAFTGKRSRGHINYEPLLYNSESLELVDSGTDFFHVGLQVGKGVTWAVLETKRGHRRFAALGTHFWWQHNGKESDAIRELNARHILWVVNSLRSKWGKDMPVIMGGDLNSWEHSRAHAMLRQGGFANAALEADVRSPHTSHHGNPVRGEDGKLHGSLCPAELDKPERSLDYIYHTKGINPLRHEVIVDQPTLDVSDHSPVLVEFELHSDA